MSSVERRLEAVVGQRAVRFIQFCGVGGVGGVVDLAVTTAALAVMHYIAAQLVGFLAAVSFNFVGNWIWTFDRPSGSIPRQYGSYVGLHSVTFGVRVAVVATLVELAGAPILVATVLGVAAAAVANYLGIERILEDGLEWFDAVAALSSLAHVIYGSRLRTALRDRGLYDPLYRAYARLLAAIYPADTIEIDVGGASAELVVDAAPSEIVSVTHTLRKERPVLEQFVDDIEEGSVVWDVGANVGVYAALAAAAGADRVLAIEPVPATVQRLEATLSRVSAETLALEAALGAEQETAELILERDELATQTATLDEDLVDGRATVEVDVVDGDRLLGHVKPPDILKLDVEGAELEALAGLEAVLEDIDAALVETHGTAGAVRTQLEAADLDVDRVAEADDQVYLRGRR
jgi:FkbM family methyltransferase